MVNNKIKKYTLTLLLSLGILTSMYSTAEAKATPKTNTPQIVSTQIKTSNQPVSIKQINEVPKEIIQPIQDLSNKLNQSTMPKEQKDSIIKDFIKSYTQQYPSEKSGKIQGYLKLYTMKDIVAKWGFNGDIKEWVSNDRNYEWYIDQKDTGKFSSDNCGPSVATMALKWANKDFDKNVEDARNQYVSNGGWWYTNHIESYLYNYNISNYEEWFNYSDTQIKTIIDEGKIIILCVNTNPITHNYNDEERTGLYHPGVEGHFVLIKGYIQTDKELYLEAYDPDSWGAKYEDGTLKGKDRYYSLSDINEAVRLRWHKMIVINPVEK